MRKNPGGRPKKPVMKKGEQLSIRLTPEAKAALDALARLKAESLSGAVAAVLLEQADNYKTEGEGLLSAIRRQYEATMTGLRDQLTEANSDDLLNALEGWRVWLWTSDVGRLFILPPTLLTDEETAIVGALRDDLWRLHPSTCDQASYDVKSMLVLGVPLDEVKDFIRKYPTPK